MTETVALQKGVQGDYIPATWSGENTSGLTVYGIHVLVRMDECSPVTQGGAYLPDDMIERRTAQSETGCIYALGGGAFSHYSNGRPWSDDRPAIGDRVYVERFAGVMARGMDGHVYRIMEYTAVAAGMLPGVVVGEPVAPASGERE